MASFVVSLALNNPLLGASKVKWTTHDPCLVFSECVSVLYTNFEFYEGKNHKHFKSKLIYKAKHITMTKNIPRKVYIF